ncbi:unnamed protein product [Coffea canephora]|uniref:Uncharacterized protein n=1 Tax=Coffea canephora TaxID=49390 RepID=A0A068UYK5_COFCA|nr:unnamed protein product [Coffea canephora]
MVRVLLNLAALFAQLQLSTTKYLLMSFGMVESNPSQCTSQNLKPGETPIEFAERVRDIISVRAGLKKVPWDRYLKYSRPSPKHRERK